MCFGVNVGLDTRCVHRKFQVCRLSTKKSYIRKIVRKEKSLKPGNVRALTGLFCVASQNPGRIVWPQVCQICTSQTEKFSRYRLILYFSPIKY